MRKSSNWVIVSCSTKAVPRPIRQFNYPCLFSGHGESYSLFVCYVLGLLLLHNNRLFIFQTCRVITDLNLFFFFLGSVTICVRENVKLKHFWNSSVKHSMVTFHDSLTNEGQNGDWAIRVRSTSIASEVALMSSSDRRSSHRQITTSFRLKEVYCARRGNPRLEPSLVATTKVKWRIF